jgi:hypothetical protein
MTGGSNAVNRISLLLWLIFVVVHDRHRGNAIGTETTAESVLVPFVKCSFIVLLVRVLIDPF